MDQTIKSIVRDTTLFLNMLTSSPEGNAKISVLHKLFMSDLEKTLTVLDEIEIKNQSVHCSFNGNATDGSYSELEGSKLICLSSTRLIEKLDTINYYPQTISLMVHELAHALGADEDTATKAQQEALDLTSKTSRDEVENADSSNLEALNKIFGDEQITDCKNIKSLYSPVLFSYSNTESCKIERLVDSCGNWNLGDWEQANKRIMSLYEDYRKSVNLPKAVNGEGGFPFEYQSLDPQSTSVTCSTDTLKTDQEAISVTEDPIMADEAVMPVEGGTEESVVDETLPEVEGTEPLKTDEKATPSE